MTTIRPNAEPAATIPAVGDIFLIDGATGVRALAASSVVTRDANANASINNPILGYATTATAASTTTLTAASAAQQFFTGSTTQTVLLPVTSTLSLGQAFAFQNDSTGAVTIQSSGANAILVMAPGTDAIITCVAITGTTAASWDVIYFGVVPASGKVLTVSNSLTLAGTDATVMTFPGASDTVVTLGATQTLTGKTLTAPIIAAISNTGTLTLPTSNDTLVGRATTDALTNKTLDSAGTGNVLKVSGVQVSAGQYPGEPSTGNATAGNHGEYVPSDIAVGSAVVLTSTIAANVTSISLTAGDWDVSSTIGFTGGVTTTVNHLNGSLSTTTGTLDTTDGRYSVVVPAGQTTFNFDNPRFTIGPSRFSLSATTTVFLVTQAAFGTSTCSAFGIIRARRVR